MPSGPERLLDEPAGPVEFHRARELVLANPTRWRIIYHYDGDGIAAASCALRAFARLGYPVQATPLLAVERPRMVELLTATSGPVLVVDTGASWLDVYESHPAPGRDPRPPQVSRGSPSSRAPQARGVRQPARLGRRRNGRALRGDPHLAVHRLPGRGELGQRSLGPLRSDRGPAAPERVPRPQREARRRGGVPGAREAAPAACPLRDHGRRRGLEEHRPLRSRPVGPADRGPLVPGGAGHRGGPPERGAHGARRAQAWARPSWAASSTRRSGPSSRRSSPRTDTWYRASRSTPRSSPTGRTPPDGRGSLRSGSRSPSGTGRRSSGPGSTRKRGGAASFRPSFGWRKRGLTP